MFKKEVEKVLSKEGNVEKCFTKVVSIMILVLNFISTYSTSLYTSKK